MSKHAEEITQLIEQQQEVIPFLKTLTIADRKKLVPILSELFQKYNGRHEIMKQYSDGTSYKSYGEYIYPEKHRDLLSQAGIICCHTVTLFRNNFGWNELGIALRDDIIENIYPWYVPNWLNRSVNRIAAASQMIYYQKAMEMAKLGYIKPTDEFLARMLVGSLVQYEPVTRKVIYCLDRLEDYPEMLEKHIWFLFEIPTAIHSNYYPRVNEPRFEDKNPWSIALKELIGNKKIDRQKVLSKCLLACTKGFNKALVGWFYKLFKELEQTNEELLSLQNEILTCINSDVSQAIKTGLDAIKKILHEPAFKTHDFLNVAPMLLTGTVKTTLNSTLMLLDKIATKNKAHKEKVCLVAIEALSSEYENIQVKAAKLIKKHAPESEAIAEHLADYSSYLFSEAKGILSDLLPEGVEEDLEMEEEELVIDTFDLLEEEYRIETYEGFDELLFFVSQVLDNNAPQHAEQLLKHLPKLNELVTAENVGRLDSVFTRAAKRVIGFSAWQGSAISIAAFYLNDYAEMLLKRFPNSLPGRKAYLKKIYAQHISYRDALKPLNAKGSDLKAYDLLGHSFLLSQTLLSKNIAIDLLACPTHYPCWLDPNVLVDRILSFNENKIPIDLIDWQIACLRLPLGQKASPATLAKINRIQEEDLRKALSYYFAESDLDLSAVQNVNWFIPLILSKKNPTELTQLQEKLNDPLIHIIQDYTWIYEEIEYKGQDWDYKKRAFKDVIRSKTVLSIAELNEQTAKKEGLYTKVKNLFQASVSATKVEGMFGHFDFKNNAQRYSWVHLNSLDAKRFLMICPNHFSLYLSKVIKHRMETSDITGEDEKRLMIAIMEILIEVWHRKEESEINYVFLAATMLCSVKTARQLVAELWIKAVAYNIMDSHQLGTIIGKLLSKNYGPLKRLTDLITTSLYNLSALHDGELLTFLAALIQNMGDVPITNTKKVLELYSELLVKRKDRTTVKEVAPKLEIWKQTKSLKAVIGRIG